MYTVILTKNALKDTKLLKAAKIEKRAKELLEILMIDPLKNLPPYEKLSGDLKGVYSRRINIKHRLIYCIDENNKVVHVLRMGTHYQQ